MLTNENKNTSSFYISIRLHNLLLEKEFKITSDRHDTLDRLQRLIKKNPTFAGLLAEFQNSLIDFYQAIEDGNFERFVALQSWFEPYFSKWDMNKLDYKNRFILQIMNLKKADLADWTLSQHLFWAQCGSQHYITTTSRRTKPLADANQEWLSLLQQGTPLAYRRDEVNWAFAEITHYFNTQGTAVTPAIKKLITQKGLTVGALSSFVGRCNEKQTARWQFQQLVNTFPQEIAPQLPEMVKLHFCNLTVITKPLASYMTAAELRDNQQIMEIKEIIPSIVDAVHVLENIAKRNPAWYVIVQVNKLKEQLRDLSTGPRFAGDYIPTWCDVLRVLPLNCQQIFVYDQNLVGDRAAFIIFLTRLKARLESDGEQNEIVQANCACISEVINKNQQWIDFLAGKKPILPILDPTLNNIHDSLAGYFSTVTPHIEIDRALFSSLFEQGMTHKALYHMYNDMAKTPVEKLNLFCRLHKLLTQFSQYRKEDEVSFSTWVEGNVNDYFFMGQFHAIKTQADRLIKSQALTPGQIDEARNIVAYYSYLHNSNVDIDKTSTRVSIRLLNIPILSLTRLIDVAKMRTNEFDKKLFDLIDACRNRKPVVGTQKDYFILLSGLERSVLDFVSNKNYQAFLADPTNGLILRELDNLMDDIRKEYQRIKFKFSAQSIKSKSIDTDARNRVISTSRDEAEGFEHTPYEITAPGQQCYKTNPFEQLIVARSLRFWQVKSAGSGGGSSSVQQPLISSKAVETAMNGHSTDSERTTFYGVNL